MTEIFYAMDHVLLIDDYNDPDNHKHLAKHLIISLSGEINCFIEDEQVTCEGIMISPDVFHTIESDGNDVLVYLFDETTDIAMEIEEKYLKGSPYHALNLATVKEIKSIWNESMVDRSDVHQVQKIYSNTYERILKSCNLDTKSPYIKDYRIKKVLCLLRGREEIKEGIIGELAQMVFLSQSRLSHLFKKETKISINSFLVIMKILKTYKYMLLGENITDSSIKAGFNSPSHFATTNKNMFGLSANKFRKDAIFTQV
ncbi:helix-turn-helix domain-containing protein [Clostridium estertheticum]|uniref:helix-turn-helix domain-containing protein n=1 Tax=Clostridium estertheticum TaxID=238834 RepID=UPI001C0D740D|nr:helix-turn-helix domain-containing protein [Clostridium estertheticum]MBU3076035.1 helix-turn-helix domain-containing protein [Clostridium estertheticum]MBU3166155.1 helix-turn-helix domain-containing protein [Clostridium estertheticum]